MAQIRHKELFSFDLAAWEGKNRVKVGHNREIELDRREKCLSFYLHGNCIAQATLEARGNVLVFLDHCGWAGKTTNAAMSDFLKACKIAGGVSFAKGDFSGKYRANNGEFVDMVQTCGMLKFMAPKGCRLCAN